MPFDRRDFLFDLARNAALFAVVPNVWRVTWRPRFADDPFQLGVASGDPTPTGAMLWTRLAPSPLEPDGGMNGLRTVVNWEVADDDKFSQDREAGTRDRGAGARATAFTSTSTDSSPIAGTSTASRRATRRAPSAASAPTPADERDHAAALRLRLLPALRVGTTTRRTITSRARTSISSRTSATTSTSTARHTTRCARTANPEVARSRRLSHSLRRSTSPTRRSRRRTRAVRGS